MPIERFDELEKMLGVSDEQMLNILEISSSTLAKRRKKGRFKKAESERLARIAQILDHAINTLGSLEAARRWLTPSQYGRGGVTPLSYMDTEQGAREVDNLLGRIAHGILSYYQLDERRAARLAAHGRLAAQLVPA